MKKEVIDVPGISRHLKKEGIPLSAAVRAGVGSWPKKFDVEIECVALA